MKKMLLAALALLALAPALRAGPDPLWQNNGIYIVESNEPPINALNFVNNSGASFTFSGTDPYTTFGTINYTNLGVIDASPGFDFQTFPTDFGQVQRAGTFVNRAVGNIGGIINAGSAFTLFVPGTGLAGGGVLSFLFGSAQLVIDATNIVNSGTLSMGESSLIKLSGRDVDLTRGTVLMTNTSGIILSPSGLFFSSLSTGGVLDNYWGVGFADPHYLGIPTSIGQAFPIFPDYFYGNPVFTDGYDITERAGSTLFRDFAMDLFNPTIYINDSGVVGSNDWVQAVFLVNPKGVFYATNFPSTNVPFLNTVYFPGAVAGANPPYEIAVQWEWLATNWPSRTVTTNYIFLEDGFGETTNIGLRLNGSVNPQSVFPQPTYIPENYDFVLGVPFSSATFFPTTPALPVASAVGALGPAGIIFSNDYAAYEAYFTAATGLPTDLQGGNVTNMAGRIEISGENSLTLSGAHIAALNYLLLQASNHFRGAAGAQVISPNSDFYLRTTNGMLSFTNLVAPYLPRPSGTCDLWSCRYTNVDALSITNSYHVLFVNSQIEPTTVPYVQTCHLSVTGSPNANNNLFISDVLNVTVDLLLNAQAITLTTNDPLAAVPTGQLNISNPNIQWPAATPGLLYLTNFGQISNANTVFFGGPPTSPATHNPTNRPYVAFVNHGNVLNQGSQIYSGYLENSGLFNAGVGTIELYGASAALLTNGMFLAGGDIGLQSSSLLISNHVLQAAAAITLSVSNYLDDGSYASGSAFPVTNKNIWSDGNGLNLPVLPTNASLLATTVTNISSSYSPVVSSTWAGKDLGLSPAGFSGNAALGHLVLYGQDPNSLFAFSAPVGSSASALYVDKLELVNTATNEDGAGNLTSVQINSGMTIYYAQAIQTTINANGVTTSTMQFAEKLNGRNNGRFVWVSNYNCGFFSSTNVVVVGVTNPVNLARWGVDGRGFGEDLPPLTVFTPCPPPPPAAPPILASSGGSSAVLRTLETPVTYAASTPGPTNAFTMTQGSYSGLFHVPDGVTVGTAGYLNLKTTSRGTYSGLLQLGGKSYPLSGKFSSTGWATNYVGRGSSMLTVLVHLDLSGADGLQGYVSTSGWSAELQADHQAAARAATQAGYVGNYTMVIPPGDTGPQGVSFGAVNVSSAGTVRWNATLSDGSKVSQTSPFSSEGIWPLYSSLYGGKGSILGWIQFTNGGLTGEVIWMKSAGLSMPHSYVGGFTNEVWASGSLYSAPPPNTRLSGWSEGTGSITFDGAGISGFTHPLSLDVHNRVSSPATNGLSLTLSTSSGLFSGSALNPETGKRVPFSGVLLKQDSTFGVGFFLNTNLSGEVYLSPTP